MLKSLLETAVAVAAISVISVTTALPKEAVASDNAQSSSMWSYDSWLKSHFSPMFSAFIYSAMDELQSDASDKFEKTLAILMIAKEHAPNDTAMSAVKSAVSAITDWRKQEAENFPTNDSVSSATQSLQSALHNSRISLNQSYPEESALVKKLIATHLFPGHEDKVTIQYDGIPEVAGEILLLTYFTDPRSVKYDPDVAAFVTGKNLDGSDSKTQIKFTLSGEKFDLQSAKQGKEIQATLQGIMSQLDPAIPIRQNATVVDNRLYVSVEVIGMQYAPVISSYLKETLAVGNGNRYIFGAANGLEAVERFLQSQSYGGQAVLTKGADALASSLNTIEKGLRSKLLSARWVTATPDTVKATLQKASALKIAHEQANLESALAAMKESGASEEGIAARTAKTAKWVQDAKDELAGSLAKIEKSVTDVEASPAYAEANQLGKSDMKLGAAESAGGIRVVTLDRALKAATFVIAGYYLYEGTNQMMRTQDPAERYLIWQNYGMKVADTLIYAVPAIGEIAVAIDIGSFTINHTIAKMLDSDVTLPNTGALMDKIPRWSEDVGFWLGNSSRFQFYLQNELISLQIPAMGKKPSGEMTDHNKMLLEKSVSDPSAQAKFSDELKALSLKYLLLIQALNDRLENGRNQEFGKYEEVLNHDLYDATIGYMTTSGTLIAPVSPAPVAEVTD
jgi:hypothetical protein